MINTWQEEMSEQLPSKACIQEFCHEINMRFAPCYVNVSTSLLLRAFPYLFALHVPISVASIRIVVVYCPIFIIDLAPTTDARSLSWLFLNPTHWAYDTGPLATFPHRSCLLQSLNCLSSSLIQARHVVVRFFVLQIEVEHRSRPWDAQLHVSQLVSSHSCTQGRYR